MKDKSLYHSPGWYEEKCLNEDFRSPVIKKMLKSDTRDRWDPQLHDIENIALYQEYWDSGEFQIRHAVRIGEICLEEIKSDDKINWNRFIKGIDDDTEYFSDVIDKIARQSLGGTDKLLHSTILKIRREKQKPLSIKKRIRMLKINPYASSHGALVEDTTLHTWSNPYGSQKDYYKEMTNHLLVMALLDSVKERMKLILLYEIEGINKKIRRHLERGIEVDTLLQGNVDENELSLATMLSIGKIRDYIKAMNEYNRVTRDLVDTDKATEKINKLLGIEKKGKIKGFE